MKTLRYAAIAATVIATFGSAAFAQTAKPPIVATPLGGTTTSLIIPSSSLVDSADKGLRAHTNIQFYNPAGIAAMKGMTVMPAVSPSVGPPYAGYGFETPGSLACLYGLVPAQAGCNPNTAKTIPANKGSKAIVIVDAYHLASAASDLQGFSTQFGLPAANLTVYKATSAGACNGPTPGSVSNWGVEAALDIEMAHAMAPYARIYLVEAQTNSYADLTGAVKCGNSLLGSIGGGEMSMSWGGVEFAGQTAYDANFAQPNVVYFASSGDDPSVSWPSSSPKVVSVGGTTIQRSQTTFAFKRYASWVDAGMGASTIYAMPSYQVGVPGIGGTMRATPDISAVANPQTGVWVLYGGSWYTVGGTSVAAPLVAGITNAHGSFKPSTLGEQRAIYNAKKLSATANFAVATTGYCGAHAEYAVADTWNWCVGVGTIKQTGGVTPLAEASR